MKKLIFVAVCAAMMVGCGPTKPVAGSEKVRVTNTEPQGCRFLGDITGGQQTLFTTAANLETGARNDLKNKAAAMGGNVVYLLTNHTGQILIRGSGGQDSATVSGNVYYCAQQ